jgi:hypothetical protein
VIDLSKYADIVAVVDMMLVVSWRQIKTREGHDEQTLSLELSQGRTKLLCDEHHMQIMMQSSGGHG